MALALFNDPFFEMERSLNRAMAPFFSAPTAVAPPRQSLALFDVKETENSYQLVADTPGLTAEDVNVELSPDNTVLTISGQRKHDTQTEKKDKQGHVHVRYHRQERSFFKFSRSFRLPEDARPDAITARMGNGVLTVDIQKRPKEAPAAKARRIAVQTTPAALTQGPVAEEPAGPQAAPAAAATGGSQ